MNILFRCPNRFFYFFIEECLKVLYGNKGDRNKKYHNGERFWRFTMFEVLLVDDEALVRDAISA
ncbi:MAG: hypothetical protein K0S76_2670, partial [Herbinix sp.]|nr:hypothetical protein [Herbinix sp.]